MSGGNGGRQQGASQGQQANHGGYMRGSISGTSGFAPLDMQAGYPGPPGGMPSLPHMLNLNQMANGPGQPPLPQFASNQSLSSLPSAGSLNSLSSLAAGVTPGGMSQRMLGGLLDDMGVSTGMGNAAQPPHPLSQGMNMHNMPNQGLSSPYMQQQQGPPGGLPPHNAPMGQYSGQVPPTQVGKDDIIPTAIVIKNIPFAVQKETLLAVIVCCWRRRARALADPLLRFPRHPSLHRNHMPSTTTMITASSAASPLPISGTLRRLMPSWSP